MDTNHITIGDWVGSAKGDGRLSVLGARDSASEGEASGGRGTGGGCYIRT